MRCFHAHSPPLCPAFRALQTDVFTVDTVADIGNLLKADIGFSKKWSASGLLANVFADAWCVCVTPHG